MSNASVFLWAIVPRPVFIKVSKFRLVFPSASVPVLRRAVEYASFGVNCRGLPRVAF